jgi:hypothetical protein
MAFATDVVLRDNAAADKTFSSRTTSGSRVERIDQASTPAEPRLLIIDHRRVGKSGTPEYRDEHLVQLKVTKKDAVTGKLYLGFCNVTIGQPVDGIVTRAEIDHLISFLKSGTNGFLTSTTNIDKLLRSES